MPQRCEGFPEMPEAVAGVPRIGQVGLLAAQQRRADDLDERQPGQPVHDLLCLRPPRLVQLDARGAPGQDARDVGGAAAVPEQDQRGHDNRA